MSDYTRTSITSGYNTSTAMDTELSGVETAVNSKVDKSGATMTGDLDLNSNSLLNVADGADSKDAVNLGQLQAIITSTSTTSPLMLKTTATQGQILFTAPTYTLANNSLSVYVNGQRQFVSDNYSETTTTTFTFNSVNDINLGDVIYAIVNGL